MSDLRGLRVGVALSSGGACGAAHLGVLRTLQRAGLTIDLVAGSSIGAIVAAGYALNGDLAEVERHVLGFRAGSHRQRFLPLMDRERILAHFEEITGGAHFDDCAVALAIVTTDLRRGLPVTLRAGSVARAAFASMAIPIVHRAVWWEGRPLAEGALSCVLPLRQAARPDLDLVIGSLVRETRPGLADRLAHVSLGAVRAACQWRRRGADRLDRPARLAADAAPAWAAATPTFVIEHHFTDIGVFDFHRAGEAMAAGERATVAALDQISLRLNRAHWARAALA